MPDSILTGTSFICEGLGLVSPKEDPDTKDTPVRAAQWFQEFARRPDYQALPGEEKFLNVTFPSPHQELVMQTGIEWVSLCPHHLLPYWGVAAVGYLPGAGTHVLDARLGIIDSRTWEDASSPPQYKVLGISKLARAVEYWTHWPVKQEDSTSMIADALMSYTGAQGSMVVMQATHTCMAFRGVEQPHSQTVTSAARGHFLSNAGGCKDEFLALMRCK